MRKKKFSKFNFLIVVSMFMMIDALITLPIPRRLRHSLGTQPHTATDTDH